MKCVIILALIILSIFSCSSQDNSNEFELISENIRRKESNYLITYPKNLYSGKNETFCVTLRNSVQPTEITFTFKIKDKHYTTIKQLHSDYSCFPMQVPESKFKEPVLATILVEIYSGSGTIQTAKNHDPVYIYPRHNVMFIETDRGVYKPGDRIRIRLLSLDEKLKPVINYQVPNIKLYNPHGFIVAEWDKLTADSGIVQLEFQLATETMLGKWKLESSTAVTKIFHVKKYTLPRFKAYFRYQKTLHEQAEELVFSVCARYSYGKVVKGLALIKVTYPELKLESINKFDALKNGCAQFKFPTVELQLSTISSLLLSDGWHLTILATVTEDGTSHVETETTRIRIVSSPYSLQFGNNGNGNGNTAGYFQSGLVYRGVLRLVDVYKPVLQQTVKRRESVNKAVEIVEEMEDGDMMEDGDLKKAVKIKKVVDNMKKIVGTKKIVEAKKIEEAVKKNKTTMEAVDLNTTGEAIEIIKPVVAMEINTRVEDMEIIKPMVVMEIDTTMEAIEIITPVVAMEINTTVEDMEMINPMVAMETDITTEAIETNAIMEAIEIIETMESMEIVEICYKVAARKIWNWKDEFCGNFTVLASGVGGEWFVPFQILPLKENIAFVELTARSVTQKIPITTTRLLRKWYSNTQNYLQIENANKGLRKCNSEHKFNIFYNSEQLMDNINMTLFYLIKSGNSISKLQSISFTHKSQKANYIDNLREVLGGTNKYSNTDGVIDVFALKFWLDNSNMATSQLIVYYINKGEIIAGNIDINVEKCLPNSVNAQWTENNIYPSEFASLSIKTAPYSVCAVSAVDKMALQLSHAKPLSIFGISQHLSVQKGGNVMMKSRCLHHRKKSVIITKVPSIENSFHLKRHKRSESDLNMEYDSFESFNLLGLAVITNLKLIAKPCTHEGMAMDLTEDSNNLFDEESKYDTFRYDLFNENRGISIRSYFPETWLWEMVTTNKQGEAKFSRFAPHTITSWVGTVICVSPTEGLGLSQPLELTVYQSFFVDMLVPYSIKRGEILRLQVVLFNYLNYTLPIRIMLGDTPGLELLNSPHDRSVSLCVTAGNTVTHVFRVKGSTLGRLNITVFAEVDNQNSRHCRLDKPIIKRDVVYKSLLVEPEGYTVDIINTTILCANDPINSNNITWLPNIPHDIIYDSISSKIILNTDLLGPTINNLDKLLQIPTGCGEQIMATLAPNLYILNYLNATNKLTATIKQQAIKNIKIGYQRILDYMHYDGSFSAFGQQDQSGSMFLTAFVVRTLQQANAFIFVDKNVIKKAVIWIKSNQLENGCFSAVSHVFQDMGGTSTENSTAALTAYVLVSMLESRIELSDDIKKNAMYCMKGEHNADKYTLALTSYAYYLLSWNYDGNDVMQKLMELATKQSSMMWWSSNNSSNSLNIEMTSYILLSLLHKKSTDNLVHASAIARWLNTQRGVLGGFSTTQDTVVALQALAAYGTAVISTEPECSVKIVSSSEREQIVNIRRNDRIKTKELSLDDSPRDEVKVAVAGEGCVLAQLWIKFNRNYISSSEAFTIAVNVNSVSNIDQCSMMTVLSCISYTGPGRSNMAVLEVALPSGYEPDRASLYKLTDSTDTKVKRFEEQLDRVILYFTHLDKNPICVPFFINENTIVEEQQDSVALLFDYYRPELRVSTSYKMITCQSNIISPMPSISNLTENDIRPENIKSISKRDLEVQTLKNISYGLNSDFVNFDGDMATPSGIEGNMPTYMKPQPNDENNKKFIII